VAGAATAEVVAAAETAAPKVLAAAAKVETASAKARLWRRKPMSWSRQPRSWRRRGRSRSWPQRPRSWPQQLRRCPTFNNIINVSTVRASRALLRCWDPAHGPNGGAPISPSIIAGHKRVWGKHLGEPRAVNGRMVGARSGHRRGGETQSNGGKCEVGPAPWEGEGQWLHSDAQLAQDLKFERCTAQGDTVGET
jgi:hypothetical protein